MTKRSSFRHFKTSPEIIRLAVMLYIRFPLSLRNVEVLLHKRGFDSSYETMRFCWNHLARYLDEVFVNAKMVRDKQARHGVRMLS